MILVRPQFHTVGAVYLPLAFHARAVSYDDLLTMIGDTSRTFQTCHFVWEVPCLACLHG